MIDFSTNIIELTHTPLGWVILFLWFFMLWVLASIPAAAFHLLAGAALNRLGSRAVGALGWLLGIVQIPLNSLDEINKGARQGLAHVTLVRLDTLRLTTQRAMVVLERERAKLEKVGLRMGVDKNGVGQQLKRIRADVEVLKRMPDAIELEDPRELRGRLAGAWFGAIVATPLAFGLVVLNAFMLTEFLGEMFEMRLVLFGVPIPMGLIIGSLWAIAELGLGFMLKIVNRSEKKSPGHTMTQLGLIGLILVAVGLETWLYAILSFNMANVMPPEIAQAMPAWSKGWFGAFGLILAAAVSFLGYWAGHLWMEVFHWSQYPSVRRQTTLLNGALASLPKRMEQVANAAKLSPEASGTTQSSGSKADQALEQIVRLEKTLQELTELDANTAVAHVVEGPSGELRRYPWGGMALGVAGAAGFVGTGIALMFLFARSTLLTGLSPLLSVALAWVLALAGVLGGYALTFANEIGQKDGPDGSVRWNATTWGRGGAVWRIIGLSALVVVAAVGVFLVYDIFNGMNWGISGTFVAMTLLCAAVGYGLPWIGEGLRHAVVLSIRVVLTVSAFVGGLVLTVLGYVLQFFYWAIHIIASPTLALIKLVSWLMRRPGRQGSATVARAMS